MNLIQEAQQTYEKIAKECQDTIEAKRAIIADVDANVGLLQESRNQKVDRLAYYKNVLDSNASHSAAGADPTGGDRTRGRSAGRAAATKKGGEGGGD